MFQSAMRATAAAIVVAGFSAPATATTILYDVLNLGDNVWEYQYAIQNSLDRPIDEFSIFFDLGPNREVLHSNLEVTKIAAGWDGLLLPPDPKLPDDGLFDALALSGGIAPGLILDGFAVRFSYLGAGPPPAQRFAIFDPDSFEVIDSGVATSRASTSVPEPSTVLLFASGFIALLIGRRRKARGI
jgi:hypothetical protein